MERSSKVSMRVLIADDQKGVGSTLAALVAECDHEVVEVVGSGFEAIQAYHRLRPDVVLMDYYMPRLNGVTACRNILSRYPGANVILVSGIVEAEDIGHSGAIAVLSKPIRLAQLKVLLSAPSLQNKDSREPFFRQDPIADSQPAA
jgi:two-component system, chemotaxis family, chemotaxis protein CheY